MCQANALAEMISYRQKKRNQRPPVALNQNVNKTHGNASFLQGFYGCDRQNHRITE